MAKIKFKDLKKMNDEDRKQKMKELKLEMLKQNAGKKNAREIRRTIARLLTVENSIKLSKNKSEKIKIDNSKASVKNAQKPKGSEKGGSKSK